MGDTELHEPFPPTDSSTFPNTRLRSMASIPDGMPASTDPDTCRICRGEGTTEEPLFYPCKCSGSIKFVHQDCLMEWLSHSQKKHCELCKTPFRFTKLYHPNMPKVLPFYVFVSHMAKYIFRNLLVWLRGTLVVSVWLGWLPYLMRSVWSFLFWISDEGLTTNAFAFGRSNGTTGDDAVLLSAAGYGTTTCPSSPLFAATTTVATIGGVIDRLPMESMQLVKSISGFNLTTSDPLYSTILRLLFTTVGLTEQSSPNSTIRSIETSSGAWERRKSLLSEVGFLRNLTRHHAINRTIIEILEGQIITILVIVCFILIILVRDYVVQQQPEINNRAAFAAVENLPQQDFPDNEQPDNLEGVVAVDGHAPDVHIQPAEPPWRPERWDAGEGLHRRVPRLDDGEVFEQPSAFEQHHDTSSQASSAPPSIDVDFSSLAHSAQNLHSPLLEVDLPTDDSPHVEESTVHEYLKIYREAGGDPEKILNMVKERHLEEKLDYWIRLTRSMMERPKAPDRDRGDILQQPATSTGQVAYPEEIPSRDDANSSRESDRSSEWTWPDEQREGDNKGKGKQKDQSHDASHALSTTAYSRRRANTDGPQVSESVNPLANNTWSFSNLPSDPSTSSTSEPPEPPLVSSARYGEGLLKLDELTFSNPRRPASPVGSVESPRLDTENDDIVQGLAGAANLDLGAPFEPEQLGSLPDITNFNFNTPPNAMDSTLRRKEPAGFIEHVADFMWRDVDAIDPAELAGPNGLDVFGDNLEDVFGDDAQEDAQADEAERDQEVVDAAVAAGLDPEAIEDAEDLEGIMELLGMRGPVAGLFQNAIFCAFLVSVTIFVGIFVPYNIGRVTFWTVANPMRPARMLFSISKFLQDCVLVVLGAGSWAVSHLARIVGQLSGVQAASQHLSPIIAASEQMSSNAAQRILESFVSEMPLISAGEMRNFSALSHEALLMIKARIALGVSVVSQAATYTVAGDYSLRPTDIIQWGADMSATLRDGLELVTTILSDPSSWVIDLNVPEPVSQVNPDFANWDGTDRFWAIAGGYMSLTGAAALYLRRGTPFSSSAAAQEWEASIIDGLNQASGVMKVILIIGIEMLVFPLYCGLLLDVALLPLFESTTIKSRLLFSVNYPLTSIFVHWFVGTGYMFHFALFVSMCRKIMRKGVLYFIRDPDDPEFHPVRDVLERNVTTQLRKILFSAFVYGALVIICLGGVVWGLAYSFPNVLPIHYSSNEPVLEFPIDLLFYNFLMPLAVRFFKPSDGLHAMYTWWFRKCARGLRITWFLFGERKIDEEGFLELGPESSHRDLPWWKTLFLELDANGEVIPKTWRDTFEGGKAKPTSSVAMDEIMLLGARKIDLVSSHQIRPDGRFVRTPASDQVKIPKSERVFLDVTQDNERLDGKIDRPDTDLYSTEQYQFVYVPPFFRFRIFLFIMFIWIFAAVTGIGITILPLMFGRRIFKLLIPPHIRTNDIYAFSIGIYILGSAAYGVFHLRSILAKITSWAQATLHAVSSRSAVRRVLDTARRVASFAYAYFFLLVVFPLLVASLMELYALIPLHTYMYNALLAGQTDESGQAASLANRNPHHTVRVIQAWTIGLLYLKLSARVITTWMAGTRLAAAVRAVLRRGWLEPDVTVLTRAFVIPALGVWLAAVGLPLLFARVTVANGLAGWIVKTVGGLPIQDPTTQPLPDEYLVLIYRLSFPVMAIWVAMALTLWSMVGVFQGWKIRIRDEAYLIGERLHNFGVANTAKGAWKAQGARL